MSSQMPEEIEDEAIEIEIDPDEEEHHPIVDADEPHQLMMSSKDDLDKMAYDSRYFQTNRKCVVTPMM